MRKLIGDLIRKFGYLRVESAGLLTKSSVPSDARSLFPSGAVIFPFFEANRVSYIQARLITQTKEKRWLNLNHRKLRIYNADALERWSRGEKFAICEGVIDVLSAIELGYGAIGLPGVSVSLSEKQLTQLRGRHVDILLDWDAPGEAGAEILQAELKRFGVATTRKRRPAADVKDLNDYLIRQRDIR